MEDESMLRRILNREEEPNDLPLPLLKRITKDFSDENKIGQGGFGVVYKGELGNEIIVAVKRIYDSVYTVDDKSFHREIKSLMNTSHPNIVRFLGFCSNTHKKSINGTLVNINERLLCLEYICGGSLDKHITDEFGGLEWERRYQIVTGICKGLCYLHKEKQIVHMDLKPENILLDDHMIPKITDFGLSRSNGISRSTGEHFGTPGYVAPECKEHNRSSFKCDIYSLGVIITELVTGCKSVPRKNNVLQSWIPRWGKGPIFEQTEQVTRCIEIAARCKKPEPKDRPSIGDIISFLRISESTDGLIGQTKASSVFNIGSPSKRHNTRANKGTVASRCDEYLVQITVQPQEREPQNGDKFIMRSTPARESLKVEDITTRLDEVDLMLPPERTRPQCGSEGSHPQGIGSSGFFGYVERTISPSVSSTKNWICRGFVLACLLFVLSALSLNSWRGKFSSLQVADTDKLSTASPGRGPLDVVIVYAFDSTDWTPAWYTVNKDIFWLVQEKLTHFAGSCMGYIYVKSTPNTYISDMKIVDPAETEDHSYKKVSWRSMTCTKNMASGLAEAQKMISSCGHHNSIILFFSDGLINKGDFFDGTENFISKVPVHTFTLGGDAYNNVLRSIAANSPGGMFHTTPVPERPNLSASFSKLMDNLLDGTPNGDEKPPSLISGKGPLDVVIVYAFDCTNSTPAWYTVDDGIFWLVQEKLAHFADSCMGYIYVMSTPNTYTSDMKIVDPAETKETGYTTFAWRRMTCTKNMASGLVEAHKMINNRGYRNGIILFFSDGLINKGDFFDGTENFISKVPVHTFTLGGDAYNQGLQAIAANSPGGTFNPFPVPNKPHQSAPFSKLLDSLLNGTMKDWNYQWYGPFS